MDRMKYFPLLIFIFSIVLIVYLQFNSGGSIQNLIQSNGSLLAELKARSALQKLEIEIISVESNIRGAVITGRLDHIKNVEQRIHDIRKDVKQINNEFNDPVSDSILNRLDFFVEKKITHSYNVLSTFYKEGKDSAEGVINTNRGKVLTDTIIQLLNSFDSTRQHKIHAITTRIATEGNKAMNRGMVLALIAAFFSMGAFWYIIIISRRQQKLINILDVSEKKEKEASKIKEQFLANMSHEIRTPMNAMMGFTNLLQQTKMDALQQEYVQHIQSSGNHLLSIVNDILDLSKMEAGMMRIEKEPFDFQELVHSLEPMFREKANAKNIELVFEVDENIPKILSTDAVRLKQVLVNLLSNAIKFTSSGRVTLAVDIADKKDDQISLRFTISDSGIGMTEDEIKIIFERFQQAEPSTTRRFGGTGLGLSIVRQLVGLLHGSLFVTSKKHRGSVFTLQLPFYIVSVKAITKTMNGEDFEKLSNDYSTVKILVAEDNPLNQALVKHLLAQKGMDFTIVNNGKEVLDALQRESYDLVLMDMQMPEMDGYTATEMIRRQYGNDLPVIAMTANAMPGEREKCLRLGMNDYIPKPINDVVLFELIKKYSTTSYRNNGNGMIDLAYLKELSNGDAEFERSIISQFLVQVPEELEAFQNALKANDTKAIKFVAHSLKSSVGYVGISAKTIMLLEEIENNAEMLSSAQLRSMYEVLHSDCNNAMFELSGQ